MRTLTRDGLPNAVTSPEGVVSELELLRARNRSLEEQLASNETIIARLRRKEFDASLERVVADGLKAATFKAHPDGRIIAANEHAMALCGPVFEQGGNLYSLVIDRLRPPSGIPTEDSAITEIPKSYRARLKEQIDASMYATRFERRARRPSEGFENEFSVMEQLIYDSEEGPVRVLAAVSYVSDHNGHPWIQLTLVNLDAVNRDDLTGLWRRGTFDNVLVRKVEERRRMHERLGYAPPLSLVMYDVDHFKKVNDTCGHLAGDDVLKAVARRLQRVYNRKTDLVCRYGGEELAVISDSDLEEAKVNALRGLKTIRDSDIVVPTGGGQAVIRVTASLGLAMFSDADDTPAQMIKRADMALYEAKGKNYGFWTRPIGRPAGRNRAVYDGVVLPDPDRKTR